MKNPSPLRKKGVLISGIFIVLMTILFTQYGVSQAEKSPQEAVKSEVATQDITVGDPWLSLIEFLEIPTAEVAKASPHFPKLESHNGDFAAFNKARMAWMKNYPNEVEAFMRLPKVKENNVSRVSLGIDMGIEPDVFEHSIWSMYQAANFSEETEKELFAHFPKPVLTGDHAKDAEAYNEALDFWAMIYPYEYKAFFFSKEALALNPELKAEEESMFKIFPKFLGAHISLTKPTGGKVGDLEYYRELQNWYFVFQPEKFESEFGWTPEFPEGFDEKAYRAKNIAAANGLPHLDEEEPEGTDLPEEGIENTHENH